MRANTHPTISRGMAVLLLASAASAGAAPTTAVPALASLANVVERGSDVAIGFDPKEFAAVYEEAGRTKAVVRTTTGYIRAQATVFSATGATFTDAAIVQKPGGGYLVAAKRVDAAGAVVVARTLGSTGALGVVRTLSSHAPAAYLEGGPDVAVLGGGTSVVCNAVTWKWGGSIVGVTTGFDGAPFTAPTVVGAVNGYVGANPAAVFNEFTGELLVAYTAFEEFGLNRIRLATLRLDEATRTLVRVRDVDVAGALSDPGDPAIAFNGAGWALIAYRNAGHVYARFVDYTGRLLGSVIPVSSGAPYCGRPSVTGWWVTYEKGLVAKYHDIVVATIDVLARRVLRTSTVSADPADERNPATAWTGDQTLVTTWDVVRARTSGIGYESDVLINLTPSANR